MVEVLQLARPLVAKGGVSAIHDNINKDYTEVGASAGVGVGAGLAGSVSINHNYTLIDFSKKNTDVLKILTPPSIKSASIQPVSTQSNVTNSKMSKEIKKQN